MTDYKQGQFDCIMGAKLKQGMSDQYYLGYGNQYEKEQQQSHLTENV